MDVAKKPLGWFDMPGEIRNMIYQDLFTRPDPFEVVGTGLIGSRLLLRARGGKGLSVSLLRTNKRLYAEAAGILYGGNTFSFLCPIEQLGSFFETINKANARLMTRVIFPAEHAASYFTSDRIGPDHPIFILVKHCQGLRELVFDTILVCQPWHKDKWPNRNRKTPRGFPVLFRHLEQIPTLERTVVRMSHMDYRIYQNMFYRRFIRGQVVRGPIPQLGAGMAKLLGTMDRRAEDMEKMHWVWEKY
ncbi:hypothetical protein PG993_000984 [Apiospora rasikravindrae]|uniref:Uncharacterized protein n=1 Tax=Apiospora rasikravindrae TaxID=990691 RepID=A0ABR1UA62_9PEZI